MQTKANVCHTRFWGTKVHKLIKNQEYKMKKIIKKYLFGILDRKELGKNIRDSHATPLT